MDVRQGFQDKDAAQKPLAHACRTRHDACLRNWFDASSVSTELPQPSAPEVTFEKRSREPGRTQQKLRKLERKRAKAKRQAGAEFASGCQHVTTRHWLGAREGRAGHAPTELVRDLVTRRDLFFFKKKTRRHGKTTVPDAANRWS